MTLTRSILDPPAVAFDIRGVKVRVDTGELILPVVVLVFCAAYYVDTRGLPEQSMVFAGPLLYTTAVLAVVTLLTHAISLDSGSEASATDEAADTSDMSLSVTAQTMSSETDEESAHFNARSATLLAVLTAGYIALLYYLPFVIVTVAFLAATVYLFGEQKPVRILVYSIGFTFIAWSVFIAWLAVPLP